MFATVRPDGQSTAEILTALNEKQREAVETVEGPVLILAGAGSGKTKALTSRIAYMLAQGISPYSILAITFTNKAAKEMKTRVADLVGPVAERMWISTFHSFGARFLRREIEVFPPYNTQFTIYDTQDSRQVIKTILKEMNLDDKQFPPQTIQGRISQVKNALQSARDAAEAASDFFGTKVAEVMLRYEKILRANNALDFDDLLYIPARILRENEAVRAKYRERFRYILIDEYQDTNQAQYVLTNMLVGSEQNICVVGDVDQSIYSWRGADIQNIINFRKDYPAAKVLKLEQNYRSTEVILEAANRVIENNTNRPAKELWTAKKGGTRIGYYEAMTETDEALYCVQEMERLVQAGEAGYGDMAVLYRTNAQSRALEDVLVRRGVAYTMVGGTRFYERQEIKDVLAYLKLLQNPRDDVSLLRILNVPRRGIGATTVGKLEAFARTAGVSLLEAILAADEVPGLNAGSRSKLKDFAALLLEMMNWVAEDAVTDLVERVLEKTGYIRYLEEEKDPRAESRVENVGELVSVAREYEDEAEEPSLQEFLEQVSLVNDVDTYEAETAKVTLMTLHSAKGLEFPVVFLVGMDEGIFPHSRSLLDTVQLEEERRLCYVGITRAERLLYLVHATHRTVFGNTNSYLASRFLAEIPEELLERKENPLRVNWQQADSRQRVARQAVSGLAVGGGVKPKPPKTVRYDWQTGDIVRHKKWGRGRVAEVRGQGEAMQLVLDFPEQGTRLVMVKFAPLTKE